MNCISVLLLVSPGLDTGYGAFRIGSAEAKSVQRTKLTLGCLDS